VRRMMRRIRRCCRWRRLRFDSISLLEWMLELCNNDPVCISKLTTKRGIEYVQSHDIKERATFAQAN
jgi:hypothetical protein